MNADAGAGRRTACSLCNRPRPPPAGTARLAGAHRGAEEQASRGEEGLKAKSG